MMTDYQLTALAAPGVHGYGSDSRSRPESGLQENFLGIVTALAEAVECPGLGDQNHSSLTSEISVEIARRFGFTCDELQDIRWAALLHDIGKVGIPDSILSKPGPLSPEEWKIMKLHPELGAALLATVPGMQRVSRIIYQHHERFDGSGYPSGLKGNEIFLEARILALADAFSVMLHGRVYSSPRTQGEAVAEVKNCAGTHFDPGVVKEFLHLVEVGSFSLR